MILHACPFCGKWSAPDFGKDLHNALLPIQNALRQNKGQPPVEPIGYFCEDGHGPMMQIQLTDRIFIRPDADVARSIDPKAVVSIQSMGETEGEA